MATKKVWAAFVAALLVMVSVVLTSCQADSESIRTELAQPKTIETIQYVDRDKLVYINKNWNTTFDGENIVINGQKALFVDVNHRYPTIEMAAADHAAATITDANELSWRDSNGQETTGTLTKYESNDGSFTLYAALVPAENYSTLTRLHAKVSQVTTYHILSGSIVYHTANGDETSSFEFKLKRSYLLVDPSVDTQVINHTDTLIQVEVRTDTIIVEKEVEKVITNTDTIKVEIEKFVRGADINKAVVNDLGFSVGTLTLGNKQLLKVTLNHKEPVLNVEEDKLGNVSFTGAGNLVWNGTDSQVTTGTKESNNVTVKSFDYVRNEYTKVSETMVIVRTIYSVTGSFYNENNDLYEFSMELAPSYLQKVEAAPEPQIVTPEVNKYRGIIRKVTAEGLKLMTKPVVQQLVDGKWVDVRTCSRSCIGMSGSPSGLDLFVKSAKIIEETENSWNYSGNDATWAGDDTKSDGTIITKRTKVYEFNHMFEADAVNNGKVGPATQLYVMKAEKVQVLDPENNLLTCTWEDGSDFSLNISVVLNNTEFVEKAELKGQTRNESDKTYKYLTSFVQHFTATVGGQKLQDVDAVSTLWVPAE
jgi:hypothetical protein